MALRIDAPGQVSRAVAATATHEAAVSFTGTGAEILVECLVRAGVERIFGVPGDTGIALYDALYLRQGDIRHVLVRDERHAGMMADVSARCTNTVGVLEVSSGAGATFSVGGLGEAYAASVPVLVIASDINRRSRRTGAITEVDQVRLFSAVTKWAAVVESAADIPRLLREALAAATTGCPGPVALILPENTFEEEARVSIGRPRISVPGERHTPDDAVLREAAEALRRAERPAIVAGSGVHLSSAWQQLELVAERGGIPVATSIHGKGAIADVSPWALGVAGANGARPYANEYLAGADVVLFVGTRANATDTNGFKSPPRGSTRVLQIDTTAERAGRTYPGTLELVGDARAILAKLAGLPLGEARRRAPLQSWIASRASAWEAEMAAQYGSRPQNDADDTPKLNPYDVIRVLRQAASPDATIVAEPGTPTPYLAAFWKCSVAGRDVILPRGHGPMGYAIPGAIGATLARPERPVLALTTDGSFAMSCGELETIARYQLPITIVQLTNRAFGWIKMLQHLYQKEQYFSVDHGPIDAVAVARAAGLTSLRVSSLDELASAVHTSIESRRPMYIDVEVPTELTIVPPVAPWQATLAGQAERPVY